MIDLKKKTTGGHSKSERPHETLLGKTRRDERLGDGKEGLMISSTQDHLSNMLEIFFMQARA